MYAHLQDDRDSKSEADMWLQEGLPQLLSPAAIEARLKDALAKVCVGGCSSCNCCLLRLAYVQSLVFKNWLEEGHIKLRLQHAPLALCG